MKRLWLRLWLVMCAALTVALAIVVVPTLDNEAAVETPTVEWVAPLNQDFTSPETCDVETESWLQACNCIDVCKNDRQCRFFNGPGSQCVPVGPCGCKECTFLF